MKTHCKLCEAVEDSQSLKPELHNYLFMESEWFIFISSIGPIVLGHTLIISKDHHVSLSSMPTSHVQDLSKLIESIKELHSFSNIDLTFIEHGPSDTQMGGGCISHTHINVVPNVKDYIYFAFDEYLELKKLKNIIEITNIDYPYISIFTDLNEIKVYQAYNVQSQFFRKYLGTKMNILKWNWKKHPRIDLIQETNNYWNRLIKKYDKS